VGGGGATRPHKIITKKKGLRKSKEGKTNGKKEKEKKKREKKEK
jgi:hypothetical protein